MTLYALRERKGFTLLEIVLAIALSSIVLLAVYFTYFGVNQSIDAASEGQEALETGRILMELIKQDIRGMAPPPKYPLIAVIDDIEDEEPSHRINFITTSAMGANPFGLSEVGYFIYKTPEGEKYFIRRESTEIKEELGEEGVDFELSRIVTSFKLSFFDGADWVEEWNSRSAGKMPKQVRIEITVMDERGETREFVSDESIPSAL